MQLRTFTALLTTIIVVNMLPLFATSVANPTSQPQSFVNFLIPNMNGWHYIGENPIGDSYLFQNSQQNITISLKKEPLLCENSQEFNKIVLKTIQDLPKTQEYMEQRKAAVPISFLGQKNGHIIIVKSRANNQRRFVLNHLIGTQMYHIEIAEAGSSQEPSAQAVAFIGQIAAGDGKGSPPVAETVPSLQQQEAAQTHQNPVATSSGQVAGSAVSENAAVQTGQTTAAGEKQKQTVSGTGSSSNTTNQGEGFTPPANISFNSGNIAKGNIPLVRFSATDPCDPENREDGMPWGQSENGSGSFLPAGVPTIAPPIIPELKDLSAFNYNAAVSIAFEGMRLVYGPLPDDEAEKFEAAWAPLFDYPTQDIIDYLNELNPILSQFLSFREAYIRTLNDIQFLLFDAAMAVEIEDRYAWEAIMAEAAVYASVIKTLDASMQKLASQLESLGNPPNPLEAKCEAARRYKRMLPEPVVECWVGRIESEYQHEKLNTLYEPVFRHVFQFNGEYRILELGDVAPVELAKSDHDRLRHISIREIDAAYSPETGMALNGGEIQNVDCEFNFQYAVNHNSYVNMGLSCHLSGSDDKLFLQVCNWVNQYKFRNEVSNFFFERAYLWSHNNNWNKYPSNQDGSISQKALDDLADEIRADMKRYLLAEEPEIEESIEQDEKITETDSLDPMEEQIRQEAIAFHTEMINVIKHNLDRDIADRNELIKAMANAKTPDELENFKDRIKELDKRIIGQQSNMQHEQDMISSQVTGQVVRTRTVFDDYARHTFIENIRENAARMDATKRIADRIDLLIRHLPEEAQAKAREVAHNNLDPETLASGNIEKALKLRDAIYKQVLGHAEYDHARAKEAEVDAQQNEFYAQMTIVALGAVTVGMGSSALASTYGAQAATTYYGTKTLGAIWGATTGYRDGGIKGSVSGAISYWSPLGSATVQFIDGFQRAGRQPNADISSQVWEGTKQAGTGYLIGKAFELGVSLVAKGAMVTFGKDSRLFKPIIQSPSSRTREMLDGMRTQQNKLNARDEVSTFQKLETDLAMLKRNPTGNAPKIAQMEKELNQLAAGLNMSYHAKWHLKYKADPLTRMRFDRRIQHNYTEMTPGMVRRLEQQGYNMDNIEFRQFRNANSAGTSSMDLDLGPVLKGTGREPGVKVFKQKFITKRDGSIVTLEQFTNDAQTAMNAEYRQLTGMSATASDMNLVTSAHKEAFSTPLLLDHNIDFSSYTPDEVASVGKVLQVKMDGINKNQMLTNTTKMQAKAREASKEIENMLLRKLNSDLQKAPAGSSQRKQVEADIKYWEDMLQRFKTIGTDETNPSKIMELNREIMKETGGRDVNGVINDLTRAFGT
jgi:hypothetical protein